jgi:hypothetical protein
MNTPPKKPRWQKILELENEARTGERAVGGAAAAPIASNRICRGQGGTLELLDDCVIIHRGLLWGLIFQKGIKGDKRIPFASIAAVQYKRPGLMTGYIQFSIAGGIENTRGIIGAASDENTIQFVSRIEFERAREFIENKLRLRDQGGPKSIGAVLPSITVAEQLEKLASLLDRGLLTKDEFDAQKQAILSPASSARQE